jgi:hypothetical protein
MAQLWTIIFVTLVGIGFGIAAWHDHEAAKRQKRRAAVYEKRNKTTED